MASGLLQIELPMETLDHLAQMARQQQRTVDALVRDLILQELPGLPALPEDLEMELAAFERLSDEALRLLMDGTLTAEQQKELAALNDAAQQRALVPEEVGRQQELIEAYDRVLVRRAQAAAILKGRGHQLPDLRDNS